MNADLEQTLDELGPEYRAMVARMREAYDVGGEGAPRLVAPSGGFARGYAETWGKVHGAGRWWRIAAAVAVAVGLAVVLWPRKDAARVYTVRATEAALEYRLADMRNDEAVKELIRTQRPDGSWGTAFLTRRNAEALRSVKTEEARIAYKKAQHNLRCRGRARENEE